MKLFKHLILFSMLTLLCSFRTATFEVDFKVTESGTPISKSPYSFNYGQKFVMLKPNCATKEEIDYDTIWTRIKTSNNEDYAIINCADDYSYLTNYTSNEWQLDGDLYSLVPIDNYLLQGDSFGAAASLTDYILDVDTSYEDQTALDIIIALATTNNKQYVVNGTTDFRPVIEGQTQVFVTNVDNPASIDDVKATLKAFDDIDGDLTASIEVEKDGYTGNEHTVGDYEVIFSVSDSALNKATLKMQVSVVDISKPTFNDVDIINVSIDNPLSLEEIKQKITVSDNVDENLEFTILEDNYSGNESTLGQYTLSLEVSDKSGNTTNKVITINVIDDTKPTIDGTSSYVASIHNKISLDRIKAGLTVNDNADKTLTLDNLVLVKDTYSENYNKIGKYYIEYKITDASKNESEIFHIDIEVKDSKKPIFYAKEVLINLDEYTTLNHDQIVEILLKTNNIDESRITNLSKQVVVTYDDYKESEVTGEYQMNLKITYDDGETKDLSVVINKLGGEQIINLPWYTKFINNISFTYMKVNTWLNNIWKSIVDFFKNLI